MQATPVSSAIPTCASDADRDAMYATLADVGCLVVTDVLPLAQCRRIERELASEMDAAPLVEQDDPKQFYPGRTRRVTGLVSRSETVREVILHDLSRELSERHLGANCERIQLNVTAAISIGPGARAQELHREEDLFPFFPAPRPNLILASMWAINDFTADNGGTLLVPGSHTWGGERQALPGEVAAAQMPGGLGALLVGRHIAWRRCQHIEHLALRRHPHLLLGLAAPGGKPIPRRSARGVGDADARTASAHRPCDARRPRLLGGKRGGCGSGAVALSTR